MNPCDLVVLKLTGRGKNLLSFMCQRELHIHKLQTLTCSNCSKLGVLNVNSDFSYTYESHESRME